MENHYKFGLVEKTISHLMIFTPMSVIAFEVFYKTKIKILHHSWKITITHKVVDKLLCCRFSNLFPVKPFELETITKKVTHDLATLWWKMNLATVQSSQNHFLNNITCIAIFLNRSPKLFQICKDIAMFLALPVRHGKQGVTCLWTNQLHQNYDSLTIHTVSVADSTSLFKNLRG